MYRKLHLGFCPWTSQTEVSVVTPGGAGCRRSRISARGGEVSRGGCRWWVSEPRKKKNEKTHTCDERSIGLRYKEHPSLQSRSLLESVVSVIYELIHVYYLSHQYKSRRGALTYR